MKKFSIFALAAIFFAACATDQTVDLRPADAPDTIYASFDESNADSRVYVEQGTHLCWTAGDEISYFPGVTFNMQYRFKGETGATNGSFQKMTFDPVTGIDLQCNYAIYPFAETTEIAADGTIAYHFPSVQHYAENSFGLGANVMVAATKDVDDSVLRFRNAGGYLKLQLYGSDEVVKSIELKGNNNEKIAGAATITMTYGDVPAVAMSDDATSSVSIDCGDGVALSTSAENPTSFWFVLPEVTFEKGFAITVTNTNGELFEKVTSNEVVITRNEIQPMAAIEVEFASVGPASNEIWYTSSDGKAVTPNDPTAFGVSIKSNVYENGKGVITFDGNITSIGEDAFYNCSSLTSITIPDSVTSIECGAFSGCSSLTAFYGKFASADNRCWIVDGVLNSFAPADLTEYTIPDSVTSIGEDAFYCCRSLISVTIPDSVTSIGESAFNGCGNLASVTIGNSVTSIGSKAFYVCRSLTSVTLPDSVTSIGSRAFAFCSSLTSVTIPDSVTSIEQYAFLNCRSLTSVYCKPTTPPYTFDYIFMYQSGNYAYYIGCKIYVPASDDDSIINAYKAAAGWRKYESYIEEYDFSAEQ